MAQVDIINYFSILFWFFLLFIINYLINYSFLLPLSYTTISIRFLIYKYYLILFKLRYQSYIKIYNLYFYIRNLFLYVLNVIKNVYVI